jgi:hypothetical protein
MYKNAADEGPMASAIEISVRTWQASVKLRLCSYHRVPPKKRRTIEREACQVDQRETRKEKLTRLLLAEEDKVWVWACLVEFSRPGCEPIRFRVNPLKDGRFTFSDPRGRDAGTGGTTGLWGTRPALRQLRPRSLTPSAFKAEAARFVGKERADEIVRQVVSHEFFSGYLRQV